MVRFSKFDLVLKAESKAYKFWRAINVCEFVKIAKFANINRARTFVDLQYDTDYRFIILHKLYCIDGVILKEELAGPY